VQRWRRRYAAVRKELVRERKRTERLLQHQREQDTKASSPARGRGSRRWRGCQQEGAGRGAGERGRRGDAKPQRARVPGRGNSGAPRSQEFKELRRPRSSLSQSETENLRYHRRCGANLERVRTVGSGSHNVAGGSIQTEGLHSQTASVIWRCEP
jgi:hypothetical protein